MNVRAVSLPTGVREIDRSRRFIPERITHLPGTLSYRLLSEPARLRYNQLFALMANELTMWFESSFSKVYVLLAESGLFSPDVSRRIEKLVLEEREHTMLYAELNRRAAPRLYAERDYVFVQVPCWMTVFSLPKRLQLYFAPGIVLLASLLEERFLYYAGLFREERSLLEPSFFEVSAGHCEDEIGHVELNMHLLQLLWENASPIRRRVNAYVTRVALVNFFLAPKRAGRRVIDELLLEFPELEAVRGAIFSDLAGLSSDGEFLGRLYSGVTNPLCSVFLRNVPELRPVAEVLPGCAGGHVGRGQSA